ncbi:prolyl-tRNA synthetase associated domain-containing protein [Desulfosarcina sp.]|uniref:prolyl-tRNA synthetase associated domain-containing protein n=1 Tax=Desulfosarcina sp. TaxID=2027861 RepID=UPI003970536D
MQIYDYLETHGIPYERHDHPPVFTCEDVNRLVPTLRGRKTKNLFMCDNKGKQHFLVTVPDEKSVDLKSFGEVLEVKKLRFASADRLQKHLKLDPGAVTILGVVNDEARQVRVIMDKAIWEAEALQCHPLVNTATLVITLDNIRRFLDATGHRAMVMDVPARD